MVVEIFATPPVLVDHEEVGVVVGGVEVVVETARRSLDTYCAGL